jgi:hypothetical protein
VNPEQLTFAVGIGRKVEEEDIPSARLLRRLLAGGMPLELVPAAARIVAELEELAVEERERERAA